ncbi:conserved membrane hypothetical protein [Cupriavidus taiwanensis]|uniref:hypothetical protein n=1 Tax=Cupriavidus taiwanensis TaxID=164546 RepID=UPI000E1804E7|nr:hypothetical protein [Cupriavidus taiwanensis]SPA03179.1 conserved membrane hypothetical protein [Cupriavidus taiwanensis]SPA22379.1 conserved membrane hypothetical protein [Cupriavidus taiwanensis]
MSLGAGIILICIVALLSTWFAFGRKIENNRSAKFIYWLKSTITMGALLSTWVIYKEPALGVIPAIAISMALSAFLNLVRSQWVFLIP